MKYFSMFSGIGGFDFPSHIGYGDATKIRTDELPDFEFLVGGFLIMSRNKYDIYAVRNMQILNDFNNGLDAVQISEKHSLGLGTVLKKLEALELNGFI